MTLQPANSGLGLLTFSKGTGRILTINSWFEGQVTVYRASRIDMLYLIL